MITIRPYLPIITYNRGTPPTPNDVVISVAAGKPIVTAAVSLPLPLTSTSLEVPAIVAM